MPHVRRDMTSTRSQQRVFLKLLYLDTVSPHSKRRTAIHTSEMAEPMDIDTPIPSPASVVQPRNAMAALMANAKGKGKEIAPPAADQKAVDDKEGLPWYVPFPSLLCPTLSGC